MSSVSRIGGRAALDAPHAGDAPDPLNPPDPDDEEIEHWRTWAGDYDPGRLHVSEANELVRAMSEGREARTLAAPSLRP